MGFIDFTNFDVDSKKSDKTTENNFITFKFIQKKLFYDFTLYRCSS